MKKNLLTIIAIFFYIFIYSQSENDVALNINFNKKIQDYNLTIQDLEKNDDEYGIDLLKLKSNNNHFLKEFNFEGERAFFNENGTFLFILLQKKYSMINDLEKELIEIEYKINQKYGINLKKNKNFIVWKTKTKDITIFIVKNEIYIQFKKLKKEIKEKPVVKKTVLQYRTEMAESGNPKAEYQLSQLYYFGFEEEDLSVDKKKAFYWCKKSAEQGYSKAQFNLAGMYSYGDGTFKNIQKAFKWMEKSAKQNNKGAQYMLASMFWEGTGTLKNKKQSFYWFKKSAEQNDPNAQYQLGVLYFLGEGTLKDKSKSAYWMKKAYDNKEKGHNNPQQRAQKFWDNYELWKYE